MQFVELDRHLGRERQRVKRVRRREHLVDEALRNSMPNQIRKPDFAIGSSKVVDDAVDASTATEIDFRYLHAVL